MSTKEFDELLYFQPMPPSDVWPYMYELKHRAATEDDTLCALFYAFNLGRIYGQRQERSRRKGKHNGNRME